MKGKRKEENWDYIATENMANNHHRQHYARDETFMTLKINFV